MEGKLSLLKNLFNKLVFYQLHFILCVMYIFCFPFLYLVQTCGKGLLSAKMDKNQTIVLK